MRSVKQKSLLYLGIIYKLSIVLIIIYGLTEHAQVNTLATAIYIAVLILILVDIGVSIKERHVKKKYAIYTCLLVGQMVLMQITSLITSVSLSNTWLGVLGVSAIFITIVIILLDISKSIRRTKIYVAYGLWFIASLLIAGTVISNIAFFLGDW